jgi:hypothetical protein
MMSSQLGTLGLPDLRAGGGLGLGADEFEPLDPPVGPDREEVARASVPVRRARPAATSSSTSATRSRRSLPCIGISRVGSSRLRVRDP